MLGLIEVDVKSSFSDQQYCSITCLFDIENSGWLSHEYFKLTLKYTVE